MPAFIASAPLRLTLTGTVIVDGDSDYEEGPPATTAFTLSGPSFGSNGIASTFTVTPNGAMGSTVVVTPAATNAGSVVPTTLTFTSGTTAAQTFTVTRSTSGTSSVSITNNGGLTNSGTPISFTSSAVSDDLIDFLARSTPAVVDGGWAQRFTTAADVNNWRFTNGVGWDPNPAAGSMGSFVRWISTGGVISGDGYLQSEQRTGSNLNAHWARTFDPSVTNHSGGSTTSAVARGPGQEFCFQLRFRTNCGGGGGASGQGVTVSGGQEGGRKLWSFSRTEATNTDPGLVFQDTAYRGVLQGYREHDFQGWDTGVGSDRNEQPGSEYTEPGGAAGYCSWQQINAGSRIDCWRLDYQTPAWQTYLVHIIPSSGSGVADGLIDVFAWVPGMSDYVRVLRKQNYDMYYGGNANPIGFSEFIAWMYETGRLSGPSGQTQDYDQFIYHPGVSTIPAPGNASKLAKAAAGMSSGTWLQMTGTNLPSGLDLWSHQTPPGASGIPGFCDRMIRDPDTGTLYYLGCDHTAPMLFLKYSEANNAWTNYDGSTTHQLYPVVPWGPNTSGSGQTTHGYEHFVWETTTGTIWNRAYGGGGLPKVQRWNGGQSWTDFTYTSPTNYNEATAGMAWFPDLTGGGRIVIWQANGSGANGALFGINPATGAVTNTYTSALLAQATPLHNMCQYSQGHQIVVFGGGDNNRKIWRMGVSGAASITALDDIPTNLGNLGPRTGGTLLVNKPDGNFLAMRVASGSVVWYDFNPMAASGSQWVQKSGTPDILTTVPDNNNMFCGVPIHQHRVIAFVKPVSGSTDAQMWLYKP